MVDVTPFLPGLPPVQGKAVIARFDGGITRSLPLGAPKERLPCPLGGRSNVHFVIAETGPQPF